MGLGAAMIGVSAFTSIAGGYAQKAQAEHEKDQLKTQYQLEARKLGKERDKTIGSYVSDVGASGVMLNLEDLSRLDTEMQLDIEVAKEQYTQQRGALTVKGKQAVVSGYLGAFKSVGMGMAGGAGGSGLSSGKLTLPKLGTAYQNTGLRTSYGSLNYKTNPFGIKLR